VAEALRTLVEKDIRQLPVLQDGRLLGLLRRRDIVKWMQFHSDTHRGARPFPAGHQSI
jgi:CBS domain-containing protein